MTTDIEKAFPVSAAVKETASAEKVFAEGVLTFVKTKTVFDAATLAEAEELVKLVKSNWKRIEEARKSVAAPLWNAHRNVMAYFSPPLEALSKAEMHLKSEIARHARETAVKQIEAMHAVSAGADIVIPPSTEHTKGVSVRTSPRWEIENADAVPRQFCSPDPKKIQAHLDAHGLEAIPGVRFFEKEIVTVKT